MRWSRAAGLLVIVASAAVFAGFLIVRPATAQPKLEGTILTSKPAPDFRLSDQFGRFINLSQLHGHPVILTFMYTHCQELCPVVAEKLRRAVAELGPSGRQVAILALSTDPEADTPAAARSFSRQHGMLHRWHYLLGTRRQLSPIWNAYYIYAAPPSAPAKVRDSHTSATYLIDTTGHERVLLVGDPNEATMATDLHILAGLPPAPNGAAAIPAPEVGHPAPDLALRATDGSVVHLRDYRHRIILLNFWATWCSPCRSEMPMLAQWYRQFHGAGLVILGIDQQESPAAVRAFVRKLRIPYPVLQDQSGTISARYDVVGLPTSLLVDERGVVVSVRAGILEKTFLSTVVKPLL